MRGKRTLITRGVRESAIGARRFEQARASHAAWQLSTSAVSAGSAPAPAPGLFTSISNQAHIWKVRVRARVCVCVCVYVHHRRRRRCQACHSLCTHFFAIERYKRLSLP